MKEQKIVAVIMGQSCEKFIGMCLESVKDADAIVYCDGGSTDNTVNLIYDEYSFSPAEVASEDIYNHENKTWTKGIIPTRRIIYNDYVQEDKSMNGKQRNFYLNYIKANFPDYWCLALDADEILEDMGSVKRFINNSPEGLYSPKMRHLIGDFGHEDSTVPEHWVLNRLFKISCADKYPEVEHPVLTPLPNVQQAKTRDVLIWHLAYAPNMWDIKKRYDNHMAKSNMHTPDFLKTWYFQHLFGQYPRNQIDLRDLPEILLKEFGIDKDEFYFTSRGVELKNSIMVKQWNDYFKPKSVLDLGCGRGPYLYFWRWYCENCLGIELSKWAVNNAFCNGVNQGDISNPKTFIRRVGNWDLITAIDVLEHLDDEELKRTLMNMAESGNNFIFSIPFIGDPNLLNDRTHKQFMTKMDWIKLIESYGIKIKEPPIDWLFKEQILIGEKI